MAVALHACGEFGDNVDDGDSNDDESQVNMIKCATKIAEGGKKGVEEALAESIKAAGMRMGVRGARVRDGGTTGGREVD